MQITMSVTVLLLYIVLAVDNVVPLGSKSGPYDIVIYKLESCENQGTNQIFFKTRINNGKKGEKIYRENFYFGLPFDENMKIILVLQKLGNGGWKEFARLPMKKCEKIWKYLGSFLQSLMKSAGVTVEQCPVPAGNYTAHDWLIGLNMDNAAKVMEYGEYRALLDFYYKKPLVGCIRVYTNVVPKE